MGMLATTIVHGWWVRHRVLEVLLRLVHRVDEFMTQSNVDYMCVIVNKSASLIIVSIIIIINMYLHVYTSPVHTKMMLQFRKHNFIGDHHVLPVDGPVCRLPGLSQLSPRAVRPPHGGMPLFPTPLGPGGPPSFLPPSFYQAGLLVNMYAAAAAAAVACRQASTFPLSPGEPGSHLLPPGSALRPLPMMSSKYGRENNDDAASTGCDSLSGSFDVVRGSPRVAMGVCTDASGLPASGLCFKIQKSITAAWI